MTTPTTNFSWGKPVVGSDNNTWGTEANAVFDAIDAEMQTVLTLASGALPLAGGTMTGLLGAKTSTIAMQSVAVNSTTTNFDLSIADYIVATFTAVSTISFINTPTGANTVTGMMIRLINAGAHVPTWPSSVKWANAAGAPAFTASGTDLLGLVTDDGGTTWRELGFQQNIA